MWNVNVYIKSDTAILKMTASARLAAAISSCDQFSEHIGKSRDFCKPNWKFFMFAYRIPMSYVDVNIDIDTARRYKKEFLSLLETKKCYG